ncbi:MAG: hypothetical protein J5654_10800, partial [Victivallales bacterium]|nr:hypothetical protein [Victivallales bacterium]
MFTEVMEISRKNSFSLQNLSTSTVVFPRNTRNTRKKPFPPAGEAAPAERLEVTTETPPDRKAHA